jgi:5-methylcytosine-specific restriction endonuclease McrA
MRRYYAIDKNWETALGWELTNGVGNNLTTRQWRRLRMNQFRQARDRELQGEAFTKLCRVLGFPVDERKEKQSATSIESGHDKIQAQTVVQPVLPKQHISPPSSVTAEGIHPLAEGNIHDENKQLAEFNRPQMQETEVQQKDEDLTEKEIVNLPDDVLRRRALRPKTKTRRESLTQAFARDTYVVAYAKRRAKGVCQLCNNPAPFNDPDGRPFLECHHVQPLAEGGEDSIYNAVALCPNCHTKMHILDLPEDRAKLTSVAGKD